MNLSERILKKAFWHDNGIFYHSIESATGFFEGKCKLHGLEDWTFSIVSSTSKKNIGYCSYRRKKIAIQARFFFAMSSELVEETILHELAHALTKGHGHDAVWRAKARELGDTHARATTSIRSSRGFNESWMITSGHTRQESEFDSVAFTNKELPRSKKPTSPNFGGTEKRVGRPTKLALRLYAENIGNKSYFVTEMLDLGYKEYYAEVQWKLCKNFK